MKLPSSFDKNGLLPVGDYSLTFDELRDSILVIRPDEATDDWDSNWRFKLVSNLEILVRQLWQIGIQNIYVDGSFVENKAHPNDIDGYFECDVRYFVSGKLERDLNALDPHKIWTWKASDRNPSPDSDKAQLPTWHFYRIELYPHYESLFSGIKDEFGNDQMFPAAFRKSRREHKQKGIVKVEKN